MMKQILVVAALCAAPLIASAVDAPPPGGGGFTPQQESKFGHDFAHRIHEAKGRTDRITAIVQEMRGHVYDPAFARTFIATLEGGMQDCIGTETLDLAARLSGEPLKIFDTTIAITSRFGHWVPSCGPMLAAYYQDGAGRQQAFPILMGGEFSYPILEAFGDLFLMQLRGIQARDAIVVDALARTPESAYKYLTDHYRNPVQDFGQRLMVMFTNYNSFPFVILGGPMANLIRAASQNGHALSLLKMIGNAPTAGVVPDPVRGVVADLVSENIGAFIQKSGGESPGRLSPTERLFVIAEESQDGRHADPKRVHEIFAAMLDWARRDLPEPSNLDALTPWAEHFGTLYALGSLPLLQVIYHDEQERLAVADSISKAVGFGLDKALGAVPGAGFAVDHVIGFIMGRFQQEWAAQTTASAMHLVDRSFVGAAMVLLPILYKKDPRWVPPRHRQPSQTLESYFTEMAANSQFAPPDKASSVVFAALGDMKYRVSAAFRPWSADLN